MFTVESKDEIMAAILILLTRQANENRYLFKTSKMDFNLMRINSYYLSFSCSCKKNYHKAIDGFSCNKKKVVPGKI
jgi:hypothetical protein